MFKSTIVDGLVDFRYNVGFGHSTCSDAAQTTPTLPPSKMEGRNSLKYVHVHIESSRTISRLEKSNMALIVQECRCLEVDLPFDSLAKPTRTGIPVVYERQYSEYQVCTTST